MLLTSWLSSLRTKRFRRRVQKSAARKRQAGSIRHAEQLEDRTLLTAFTIESLSLLGSPGTGVPVTNADIIGTGTQASPEFDTLVIETVATRDAGISIDLDNITIDTIVIESVDLDGFTGPGIDINLENVTGLRTLVIESVEAHGNGPAVNVNLINTNVQFLTVFDSEVDGVHIMVDGSTVDHGRIVDNMITGGVGVEGIVLALDNGANIDGFNISDNTQISSITEDSILFDFNGVPVDGLTVEDNTFDTGAIVDVDFVVDGDTFSQPFSITNQSAPGQTLERFVLDIEPSGLEFDIDPITGRPFAPANGTEVTTGFAPPANVMQSGTVLDISFTDFDPFERFDWNIDLDLAGSQTTVSGNQLIGSIATLHFSGGQIITGTMVAIPGFPDAARFVTAQGGAGGTGINFDLDDSPLTNLLIDGNLIQGNSGYGMLFDAFQSDIQGTITNNQIDATAEDGVSFQLIDSNLIGDIISNAIGANTNHGISFEPSVAVSGLVATIPNSGQPVVVTSLGHGLQNGDRIVIAGVSGEDLDGEPVFGHNNPANGVFIVQNVTANAFEIRDPITGQQIIANSFYKGGGTWFRVEPGEAGNISGATSPTTGDIEITSTNHGLQTGDVVTIQHVTGNLTANGTHVVTVTGTHTFTLNGVSAVGDYVPGPFGRSGVWYKTFIVDVRGSVSDNFISANGGAGVNVDLPQGAVFLGDFKRNVIENNDGIGLNVTTKAGSFNLNVGSTDPADSNRFDRNVGAGVAVNVLDTGSGSYRVRNNLFTDQQDDSLSPIFEGAGFHTRLEGTLPTVEASPIIAVSEISHNTFGVDNLGNAGPGVLFGMGEGSRIDILDVSMNTFINNRDDGFRFFRRDDADLNQVVVDTNTFEGNQGDGAELRAQNTTRDPLDWEIRNNEVTNNGEYGFRIRVEADARVQANLTNNTVDFNGRIANDPNPNASGTVAGIGLSAFQAVEVLMTLDNNRIRQNFGDGFTVDAVNPFDTLRLSGDWTNNTFDGNRDNGVRTDGIAFGYSHWYDNTFNENGIDGAILLNSDDYEIRSLLRNEFMLNADDGLELGQAVHAIIGDGSVVNLNRFESNDGDGLKLSQAQSAYLASEDGVDSVGRTRRRDIIVHNNHFLFNGSAGIDAESVGFVRLVIENSIFFRNLGDGIEWKGTSGDNELTVRDSRITFNGDVDNPATAQGGRGIDFMQAGGGTTDFSVFDSVISSNAFEGVYVLNTADTSQPQERPDDPLLDGGNPFANPHINFRFRDNIVESNGNATILATIPTQSPSGPAANNTVSTPNLGTTQGTLGGLVIRVGTVDSDGAIGQPWPIETFIVTSNPSFVPRLQLDGAGVDAEVRDNFFDGNFGSEVYFDSFRSTNPPVTRSNWHGGDGPQYLVTTLVRDPLSRFDLVFTGNTTNPNNSIDVLNGYAWYNNSEDEFKSRSTVSTAPQHTHNGAALTPPGPHALGGTRRRNGTRTLGNPQDILWPPSTPILPLYFGYDGEGRSTWRVEPGWDIDSDFQTSEVFGFSDFNTTVNLGGSFGELNYDWDTGEATPGNPFSDTLSLEQDQVFGLVIEPDQFELNDPTTAYTDSDSILTAYDFGPLTATIDTELIGDGSASIEHGNEDDYFKFVPQQDGTITIDLFFDSDVGDLDMELYEITPFEDLVNTEEVLIGWSTLHGVDDAQVTAEVEAGKEYVLRIFGFSTRALNATDNEYHPGTVDHYRLVIPTPVPHDQYEGEDGNETIDDATDLGQVPPTTGIMETDLSIHEAAYDNPGSGFVDEVEGNDTIWTAQDLTNAPWRQEINTNIEDFTTDDQKQLHNITIRATGDETFDYYKFHVPVDHARAIFDIDFGLTGNPGDVDTVIYVYDTDGNLLTQGNIAAANDDDIPTRETSTGSISSADPFLANPFFDVNGRSFFFETAGDYVVGVGRSDFPSPDFTESEPDFGGIAGDEVPAGSDYFLTIQIEDHQLGDPGDVDVFSIVAPGIDGLTADGFYSVNIDTDQLVRIDRFTGDVTVVGTSIGWDMHNTDMVLHDGLLYAITPDSDDIHSSPDWHLVTIDPNTGAATSVVQITVDEFGTILDPLIIEGLAVRNGQLLVAYDVANTNTSFLGEIDATTAVITRVFNYDNLALGVQDFEGISLRPDGRLIAISQTSPPASDPVVEFLELQEGPFGLASFGSFTSAGADVSDMATDGTHLFALDQGRGEIVFLDPITNSKRLTTLNLPDGLNLSGLATDYVPPVGTFYSIDTANDDLVMVNPTDGNVTVIGSIGFDMQPATDLTYLDGLIYAVTPDTQLITAANLWNLVTIDPATGAAINSVRLQLDLQNSDPTRVEGITARNGQVFIAYDADFSTPRFPDNDFNSILLGVVDVISGDVTEYVDYFLVDGGDYDFEALATTLDNEFYAASNVGGGTVEYYGLGEFPFEVNTFGTDFRVNRSISDMTVDISGVFALDNGRDEFLSLDPTDPSRVIGTIPINVGGLMLSGLTSARNARTPLDFGSLEVEVVTDDLTENIDLEIYDTDGNRIHTSTSSDGREVITFNYDPGEQYFVRVSGAPMHAARNYSLNVKRVDPDANEFTNGAIGNDTFNNATDLGSIFDASADGTIHRHTELHPVPDIPTEDNNVNGTLILSRIVTPGTPPTVTFQAPFLGGWQDLRDPSVIPWTLTPNADIGIADANTSTIFPHTSVHGFVEFAPTHHYYLIEVGPGGDRLIVETDDSNFDTEIWVFDRITGATVGTNDDSSNLDAGGGSDGGLVSATDSLVDVLLPEGLYVIGISTTAGAGSVTGITGGLMPAGSEYTMHVSLTGQPLSPAQVIDPGDSDVFTFIPSAPGQSAGFSYPDFTTNTGDLTAVDDAGVPVAGTPFLNDFVLSTAGLSAPNAAVFGPDGNLYVTTSSDPNSFEPNSVLRFDGTTGAFLDVFVAAGDGGLTDPRDLIFMPGGDLLVSSSGTNQVLRYDGADGSFDSIFATGNGLSIPDGLTFGPDGNLYIANNGANTVLRFDGTTGAFIDVFVAAGSAGLDEPTKLVFGPTDDNLYVSSSDSDEVLFYHGPAHATPGAPVNPPGPGNTGIFVSDGEGGLDTPQGLAFDPITGDLLVASEGTDAILRFASNGVDDDGDFAGYYIPPADGGLDGPVGMVFNGGDLYVVSSLTNEVLVSDTPTVLQITPHANDQTGAVWYTDSKQFVSSFDTTFSYQANAESSSGFAFVIQNDASNAIGAGLAGLGYEGIVNSIAIEFDFFDSAGLGDPNNNHVSIHTQGAAGNSANESARIGRFTPTFDLNDGQVHEVRVEYTGGALSVYIDDLFNPAITVFTDIPGLVGDTEAWVGFTGASTDQSIDILSWDYTGFEITDTNRNYEIQLDFEHEKGDLVLELFDPTFSLTTPIAISDMSGIGADFERITETLSAGRTYYVRVSGAIDLSTLSDVNPMPANGAAHSSYSLTIDDLASPLNASDSTPSLGGDEPQLEGEEPEIADDSGLVEPSAEAPTDGGDDSTPSGQTGSGRSTGEYSELTDAALAEMVEVARTYWVVSGLSDAQQAALEAVDVWLVDLPGTKLGSFSGTTLIIDRDAAGHGWYVDPEPYNSDEFSYWNAYTQYFATESSPAHGRMDLLTTLLHEFGHAVGLEDLNVSEFGSDIMARMLMAGERRLPQTLRAEGADPDALDLSQSHFLASPVDVDFFTEDTIDADVGDEIAEDENGNTSLRAAIMETNDSPGEDVINVGIGTVMLTIEGNGEDASQTGDLDITDDLMIIGDSPATTIIDGSLIFDRVLHIHAGVNVTLKDLTITGGSPFFGGNILDEGNLTLDNVTLIDNFDTFTVDSFAADTLDADPGDGVAEDASGNTTLRAAVMESNATIGDDSIVITEGTVALTIKGDGEDDSAEGDLDITDNVMISGLGVGRSIIDASAIVDRALHILPGVTVTLSDVTITGGTGLFGGGLLNEGTLILSNVEIVDNFSITRGGGIYNSGDLTLNEVTISGNHSESRGGGLFNNGAASIANFSGSVVHSNTAGSRGGGIFNEGSVDFTNSTVSGNFANSSGGGVFNEGTLALLNATIAFNTTDVAGGGIHNEDGAEATLHNSIVATNVADPTLDAGDDLFGIFNTFGFNFVGDIAGSQGLADGIDDDIVGGGLNPVFDPDLLPLGDYGGPTVSHMPNLSSPVRDAGDNDITLEFDQRGFDRVVDGDDDTLEVIDIGSVEANFFSYSGRVWQDTNDNGLQNGNEPGIPGAVVNLFDAGADMAVGGGDDVLVGQVPTDALGTYTFDNLFVGHYYIDVELKNGHIFAQQDVGTNDLIDSDVDATTGISGVFFLTGGASDQPQDAGMVPQPSTLVVTAFGDVDQDGLQGGASDVVLSGVDVELWFAGPNGVDDGGSGDDMQFATATTNASGQVTILGIPAGEYYLVVATPPGLAFTQMDAGDDDLDSDVNPYTGRSAVFTAVAGETDDSRDVGFVVESTIGDLVFADVDLDGIQDGGVEVGVSGVDVTLWQVGADNTINTADDIFIATETTDANGFYQFSNLAAGDYFLSFEKPANQVYTIQDQDNGLPNRDDVDSDVDPATLRTGLVSIGTAVDIDNVDAGLIDEARIGNFAFRDNGRDGVQSIGDLGLANVLVTLYKPGPDGQIGGGDDIFIGDTVTNANGMYEFTSLEPGQYYLSFSEPQDFDFADQNVGTDDDIDSDVDANGNTSVFTLSTAENNQSIDAGYVTETQVGNQVWLDENADGIRQTNEDGVENVIVRLYSVANDALVGETTTNADGLYRFRELQPGSYYLEFVNPEGFSFTLMDIGGVDNQDSDVIPLTGRTEPFQLLEGKFDQTRDAGLVPGANVGDFLWRDDNQDGVQQPSEPGLSGAQVDLFAVGNDGVIGGTDDVLVRTTVTDVDGFYSFEDLPAETYYVLFSDQVGFIFTLQNQSSDDSIDSDVDFSGLSHAFTVTPGQTIDNIDAGMITHSDARVGNLVFNDLDQDGIQDPGEFGIGGVRVELFAAGADGQIGGGDDVLLKALNTNANGRYAFTNLAPGRYYIGFEEPSGFDFTLKDQGANDQLDSDVDRVSGLTDAFTLASGQSNQSFDAGLINLGQAPGVPVITGPPAVTADQTPTITWNQVPDADSYDLLLYNTRLGQQIISQQGIVTNFFNVAMPLPPDTYQVFVRAANDSGRSQFSAPHNFAISGQAPTQPIFNAPTDGATVTDTTPTFVWTSSQGAATYELYVYHTGSGAEAFRNTTLTSTQFTPSGPLQSGGHEAYIRAVNSIGASPFSKIDFTVSGMVLNPPVVTSPGENELVANSRPTITWTSAGAGATYDLLMYNVDIGQEVLNQPGLTNNQFTPVSALPTANYQVFVRASTATQVSAFSTPRNFRVEGSDNAVPNLFSPEAVISDHTPTFRWTGVTNATSYELLVYNVAAGQQVIGISTDLLLYTQPTNLPSGPYQAFVRAITPSGPTQYSSPLNFQITSVNAADLFDGIEGNSPDALPLPGEEGVQLVASLADGELIPTQVVSTEDSAELNTVTMPEWNDADVNLVQDYGWRNTEPVEADAEEEIHALMTEWPEIDWWSAEAAHDGDAAIATAAKVDDAETDSADASLAVAGAFAAFGVHRLLREEETPQAKQPAAAKRRQRRSRNDD